MTACAGPSRSSPPVRAAAPFHVGLQSAVYRDEARQRSLRTVFWYPASESAQMTPQPAGDVFSSFLAAPGVPLADAHERYPVVLMSHGSGGSAINQSWLATDLAAHGFIVIAVNHVGNMVGDNSPEGYVRAWERPKDFSFVLDSVLKDPAWGPRIDAERIGAAGHSMGGYTALALVGATLNLEPIARFCTAPATRESAGCEMLRDVDYRKIDRAVSRASYRDPRVKSAFAMAPGMAGTYAQRDVAGISVPVALMLARGDELMPHAECGMRLAGQLPASTRVWVVNEAGHYSFLPECSAVGLRAAPELCRDAEAGARADIHARAQDAALEFFTQTLGAR
ncbi:hypothetical protein DRW03_27880 [Corallococcus sp. H22C18031201]|nr:hypothetical protein DRW03_27880 [Corallococcus sp. H22C18031201]